MKIIAELCQNHNGDPETLWEMLERAADSGATHAKIQGIYSGELTYREEFEFGSPDLVFARPYSAEFQRLAALDLSEDTEVEFVKKAKEFNLTPMITVFTHSGADRARKAGFTSIKIASYDCESQPLIRRVMSFAGEVIVSTGGASLKSVSSTVALLTSSDIDVAILHAKTLYPNNLDNVNMLRMLKLQYLDIPVGFSDHSLTIDGNLDLTFVAICLGAQIIERHFTILPAEATKDGPVSVNPNQLKTISNFAASPQEEKATWLRNYLMTGDHYRLFLSNSEEFTEEELRNKAYYRGRLASFHNGNACTPWTNCEHIS